MTETVSPDVSSHDESEPVERELKSAQQWWYLDPGGAVGGFAFGVLAITPSLLPRPALLQGVVLALRFSVGYLLGVIVWKFIRKMVWPNGDYPRVSRRWWIA